MSRDPLLFLEDALLAAKQIQEFTSGMDETTFLQDRKTIHACMSCFQIIGEAVKKFPISWKNSETKIPWPQIQSFRNALAHEYFHIDESVMWNTIQLDLAPLLAACERIRNRLENEANPE
jgi:uncharacterized protein with HEPN domain